MKKVIASAGLFAVGAAGLDAASAPGLTRVQTSKPWSVSAAVRGFYDDNYITAPSGSSAKRDSFGIEVAPMVSLNFPQEQNYLGASYRYSMKWYEDRDEDEIDHAHEVNLKGEHRFSERYDIYLDDQFVYAQEPDLVAGGTPLRSESDAIRNNVQVGFNAGLTERVGLGARYQNSWINFDDDGPGSRSAQLDRLEHLFNLDGRYLVREDLTALLGYQFGVTEYTGDELLFIAPGSTEESDVRDSTSHYVYVGGDADLTSTLMSTLRVGLQYIDFDDLDEDSVSPYVNAALTYTYAPGSYLQVGALYRRQATDITGLTGSVVTDQEAASLYAEVNHRLTAKLTGNLIVQGQSSEFNDGAFDGDNDNFFIAGVNLNYEINKFLAAEAGYNFDRLSSDISDRSFTRNRVYLGLRASY